MLICLIQMCVCTIINSSSSAAGEAGLASPSEWSEEAFLFLFFAPTRVIVLQVREMEKKNKAKINVWQMNSSKLCNALFPTIQKLREDLDLLWLVLAFALVPTYHCTPSYSSCSTMCLHFVFICPCCSGGRPPRNRIFLLVPTGFFLCRHHS